MRTMLTAGLIAAAATIAAVAPAQASCFYNKSDVTELRVKLNCGTFCSNDWTIPKGDYNCRGGAGGNFTVGVNPSASTFFLSSYVADRGYVTITGSCATGIKAQVWLADHSLQGETSINGPLASCR